jgi:hypothetical protein
MKPKFKNPPIYISESGCSYVRAIDILKSEVGQQEIEKMAKFSENIMGMDRKSGSRSV